MSFLDSSASHGSPTSPRPRRPSSSAPMRWSVQALRLGLVAADPPEGELPSPGPRLRVAVATQDGKSMNAHFGSARRFAVYEVTPQASRFLEVIAFGDTSDESGAHDAEAHRIGPKVACLKGRHLLFVLAIGRPAAAKAVRAPDP